MSRTLRSKILLRDGGKCHYCRRELSVAQCTLDHVKPLAVGGDRYSESNLVAACKRCNNKKGHRTYEQFVRDPDNREANQPGPKQKWPKASRHAR